MLIKKPEISVLLVNYKQKKELYNLLKSLPEFLKYISYEVLVFDNSLDLEESKDFYLFSKNKNIGYGAAINYLSLKATGAFLLILNPDVKLSGILVKEYKKFLKYQDFNKGILSLGAADKLYTLPVFSKLSKKKRFSSYAFLISTNLFRIIGGFDWNYFMYFEDDDLALKLNKFDIVSVYPNTPLARHVKSYKNTPFKKRKRYYYKSLIWFLRKNKKILGYFFIPFVYIKLKL